MTLKLLNILNESNKDMFEGFNELELKEEYPIDFNLKNFKELSSYSKKLNYAKEHLGKPIGNGTSRVVYRVDENKVLKLAKNQKGIAQNESESNWYNDSYYENIIAQVLDFDEENNYWVEMELAYRAKKSDFNKLWDIDFDKLHLYLLNKVAENNGRRRMFHIDKNVEEKFDENEYVGHLLSYIMDSGLVVGDAAKLNSWGIVHRPQGDYLVLIDFGCTNCVYKSYYS